MDREGAKKHIEYYLDDALAVRTDANPNNIPDETRFVGWQYLDSYVVVAVFSYLPEAQLSEEEAEEIAYDYLAEIRHECVACGEKAIFVV